MAVKGQPFGYMPQVFSIQVTGGDNAPDKVMEWLENNKSVLGIQRVYTTSQPPGAPVLQFRIERGIAAIVVNMGDFLVWDPNRNVLTKWGSKEFPTATYGQKGAPVDLPYQD